MPSNTGECINNKIPVILAILSVSLSHDIGEIKTQILRSEYTTNKKEYGKFVIENINHELDIEIFNLF